MLKTKVFFVLTQDNSGDQVAIFSTEKKARKYINYIKNDIDSDPANWQKPSETHWTSSGDADIYLDAQYVDQYEVK